MTATDPRDNLLLAALWDEGRPAWLQKLEPLDMPVGLVLYEAGATVQHVYFPTTAIVSLMYVLESGATAETAVVGFEGMVGVSLFMGAESSPCGAVVRSAGQGYRLKAGTLMDEFNHCGRVQQQMLRFAQAMITQMSQNAVCNRHHSVDQQLCRWLLLSLDRLHGNEVLMTQEQIATILGVRREGVTEAAIDLQKADLIAYRRGRIQVLDRAGLEQRSCECYAAVKSEYDQLLQGADPAATSNARAPEPESCPAPDVQGLGRAMPA
jgi:CRP-like cAMP-binding protein